MGDIIWDEYNAWLESIKQKIGSAQLRAAIAVNSELLFIYWELGKEITARQEDAKWGDSVLDQLSIDLRITFPNIKGFSKRNLYAIKQWYLFYKTNSEFVPQTVAQIPWGHNRLIITKIRNTEEALFYVQATLQNGWSRDQLEIQIKNNYYKTKAKAITNFTNTLPAYQSQLAIETLKDPYNFDFLGLEEDAMEREVEKAMMQNITRFLIELGKGFAFVGRQFPILVSETEYYIDLLFYHLHLRCYVAIELKVGKFKPEHAGKLNFYHSAIDTQLKHHEDKPSIGLILCRTKDKIEAEYTLRDINKPIGISEFNLTAALPQHLANELPTVEQLEQQLIRHETKANV